MPGTPPGPGMSDALAPVSRLYQSLHFARPSDRRLGKAILRKGTVDFDVDDTHIVAVVTGPPGTTRRRVTFERGQDGLRWSCTCMSTPSPWCKHAVAATIAAETTTGGIRP